MQATIYNLQGQPQDTVELNDAIFGIEPNEGVVHQAVLRQQANARLGTHNTLTRADVRGGGKKPWRQKGTGRARQGSTRSPQWRHGGVVFGPHPRSYNQDMPRKMRRLAMRSVLSDKAAQGRILLIDSFETLEPRTKAMVATLDALQLTGRKVLIMTPGRVDNLDLASGNLSNITRMHTHFLSVLDMLKAEFLVMDRASIEVIESILGQTGGRMSRPVAAPAVAPARMASPLDGGTAAPALEGGEPVGAVVAPVNASAPTAQPEIGTYAPQSAVSPAVAAPALGSAVVASSLSARPDTDADAEADDYLDPDLVPEEMGEDFASGTGAWEEDEDGEDADDENLGVFDDRDEEGV